MVPNRAVNFSLTIAGLTVRLPLCQYHKELPAACGAETLQASVIRAFPARNTTSDGGRHEAPVLGSFAALAIAATSVQAADIPLKARPTADPIWTGAYVGGNIGYSWGRTHSTETFNSAVGAALFVAPDNFKINGAIGGGQIGYNWQRRNWVFGLEADIQRSLQRGSTTFVCPAGVCSPPFGVIQVSPGPAISGTLNQKLSVVRDGACSRWRSCQPDPARLCDRRFSIWLHQIRFDARNSGDCRCISAAAQQRWVGRSVLASKRGSATTGVPSLNISIWTSAQSPIRSQRQSQHSVAASSASTLSQRSRIISCGSV